MAIPQIFGAPSRYVQGYGELKNLKKYIEWMGKSIMLVGSKNRLKDLKEKVADAFDETYTLTFVEFSGKSSVSEAERLSEEVKKCGAECLVAIGGGKVQDTCKAAAFWNNIYLVVVSTIVASDATTSATGLLYNEEGTKIVNGVLMNRNPDLVLVDTEIIMQAPTRYLVAGMGDALSTYLGARVTRAAGATNYFGGLPTEVGFNIAKLSYELLFKYGVEAKIASEQKVMTKALNTIIEVNTLMSGMGFENGGSASDHSFWFAALELPGREEWALHGEGVSFSCCCQLVMENIDVEELDRVYSFLVAVGLPVTFDDLHIYDITDDEIRLMAKNMSNNPRNYNHPFECTEEILYGAIKTADTIGKMYKAGGRLI